MIAAIEKAVLQLLADAGGEAGLGYSYRTLETYPEDWGEYLEDEKVRINAPAAWVTFDALGQGEEQSSGGNRMIAQFWLIVAAQNLRNEEATRHGGPDGDVEPGSYQLMTDAIGLLVGNSLGLDIDRISIPIGRGVSRTATLRTRKLSLQAIRLQTAFVIESLSPDASVLAPFETFHANWDVPVFGNVAAPLPDDEDADATDHIELEGDQS